MNLTLFGNRTVVARCAPGWDTSGYPPGSSCEDADGCRPGPGGRGPCHPLSACEDLPAPSTGAVCAPCPEGFEGDGVATCVDVDECAAAGACDPLTECLNYPGGYACTPCPVGFRGEGKSLCVLAVSCVSNNGGCDPLVECTRTGISSSVCGPCPPGYAGDGHVACVEIDGCASRPCYPGVECSDAPPPSAGFTCGPCPPGMAGDGVFCEEEDGCAASPCYGGGAGGEGGAAAECHDVPAPGSGFLCGPCPDGYHGDGVSCSPSPCAAAPATWWVDDPKPYARAASPTRQTATWRAERTAPQPDSSPGFSPRLDHNP